MPRICVALVLVLILAADLPAQDQRTADSLKKVLASVEPGDSIRFSLLNDISFHESNPDSSGYYADKLILLASKEEKVRWLHAGNLQKGNSERLKGDLDKAFDYYFRSLEYARSMGDPVRTGIAYSTIADTYSASGNSRSAVDYYRQAITMIREAHDSITLASIILNAGDEFFKMEKYDSALRYFEESSIIFDNQGYAIGQAYNLGNEGMVFAELGEHQKAEEAMLQATSILEETGDYYPIAVYNFYLADIYEEKGQFDLALRYAHEGHAIGLQVGLKEQVRDGALKLSELYKLRNDADNAYRYLKQYVAYRDSINSVEVVQQMADLRREFDLREKQAEIDFANREKENQQILSIALAGILALTGVLIFTLYRNNRQRKITNRQLEELNETKDKFFSIISHDLRGPVSSFYGITRIVKMYIRKKDFGALEKTFDEIDNSVKALGDLLDNLLHWAIQQRGRMPYQPDTLPVKDLFSYVCAVFATTAESKRIEIECMSTDEHVVWADRNTTQTILRNLLSNAIKFTPEGGKVLLKSVNLDPHVGIQIKDRGVGIPEEKLGKLFGSVGQTSTFGTEGEKGTGLGLQLVYEFVKLNKGKVKVESTVGEGTTFTIRFPKPQKKTTSGEQQKEATLQA